MELQKILKGLDIKSNDTVYTLNHTFSTEYLHVVYILSDRNCVIKELIFSNESFSDLNIFINFIKKTACTTIEIVLPITEDKLISKLYYDFEFFEVEHTKIASVLAKVL